MGYKSILVHVDRDPRLEVRMRVAERLAQRWQGRVVGLHVMAGVDDVYAPTPALSDMIRKARREDAAAGGAQLRARCDAIGAEFGAPLEWRTEEGHEVDTLTLHARYADLTILGQTPEEPYDGLIRELPERVVLGCGGPALIVPYAGTHETVGTRVLVAWNATREAAVAVAQAMPFLQTAESVDVATVVEAGSDPAAGETVVAALAERLARHGATTTATTVRKEGLDAPNALLNHAADIGADLLVMGCYGHSRLREQLFGGMTRRLMREMPIPTLLAH